MQQAISIETLVGRTARMLSEMSLAAEPGAYLGAEGDLLPAFGVSRPTLRQAAKMVEAEHLISVRRGTKGGFYAERPDAAQAIRLLTRYLRIEGATIDDIVAVNRPVFEAAAGLAARCEDAGLREHLRAFGERIAPYDSAAAVIRAEVELARLIASMTGNPAIELVMEIGYTFGLEERAGRLYGEAADRERARRLQADLAGAILSGDAEIAQLMVRRRSDTIAAMLAAAGPAGGA